MNRILICFSFIFSSLASAESVDSNSCKNPIPRLLEEQASNGLLVAKGLISKIQMNELNEPLESEWEFLLRNCKTNALHSQQKENVNTYADGRLNLIAYREANQLANEAIIAYKMDSAELSRYINNSLRSLETGEISVSDFEAGLANELSYLTEK